MELLEALLKVNPAERSRPDLKHHPTFDHLCFVGVQCLDVRIDANLKPWLGEDVW